MTKHKSFHLICIVVLTSRDHDKTGDMTFYQSLLPVLFSFSIMLTSPTVEPHRSKIHIKQNTKYIPIGCDFVAIFNKWL